MAIINNRDKIASEVPSQKYKDNFDAIFGKKSHASLEQACDEIAKLTKDRGEVLKDDFFQAYCDSESKINLETIDDRGISWCINSNGTLVVVLPFMVNRNGLVKNESIQKVGERISELLQR